MAKSLTADEAKVVAELNGVQGQAVDIGGYYHPDQTKTSQAMRPSATLTPPWPSSRAEPEGCARSLNG